MSSPEFQFPQRATHPYASSTYTLDSPHSAYPAPLPLSHPHEDFGYERGSIRRPVASGLYALRQEGSFGPGHEDAHYHPSREMDAYTEKTASALEVAAFYGAKKTGARKMKAGMARRLVQGKSSGVSSTDGPSRSDWAEADRD